MNFDELCKEAPEQSFTNESGEETTYKAACLSCKDRQGEDAQQQCFNDLTEKFMSEHGGKEGYVEEAKEADRK